MIDAFPSLAVPSRIGDIESAVNCNDTGPVSLGLRSNVKYHVRLRDLPAAVNSLSLDINWRYINTEGESLAVPK